jgi:hypothetical protein
VFLCVQLEFKSNLKPKAQKVVKNLKREIFSSFYYKKFFSSKQKFSENKRESAA